MLTAQEFKQLTVSLAVFVAKEDLDGVLELLATYCEPIRVDVERDYSLRFEICASCGTKKIPGCLCHGCEVKKLYEYRKGGVIT